LIFGKLIAKSLANDPREVINLVRKRSLN